MSNDPSTLSTHFHRSHINQINQYFDRGEYEAAIEFCQQVLAENEWCLDAYWYLGLAYLLNGVEDEAQTIWMAPLLEMESETDHAESIAALVTLLRQEAMRQREQENSELAWVLYQYIREFAPDDVVNLLDLLALSLQEQSFSVDDDWFGQLIQLIQQSDPIALSPHLDRLLELIRSLLVFECEGLVVFEFLEANASVFAANQRLDEFVELLMAQAKQCHQQCLIFSAIELARICYRWMPDEYFVAFNTLFLLQGGNAGHLTESIPIAQKLLQQTPSITSRLLVSHYLISGLMLTCQDWDAAYQCYETHKALLQTVGNIDIPSGTNAGQDLHSILGMGTFLLYFEDAPAVNRPIRNQVAQVAQANYRSRFTERVQQYEQQIQRRSSRLSLSQKKLKIGYLSECLRTHSVGWLARWLLKHHDQEKFEVYLYSTRYSEDHLQRSLMRDYGDRFVSLTDPAEVVADRIAQDEIDILVELDSCTSFTNCAVTALKPAPIQVSWLGFDASGIPEVDYFIVDPYVVTADADTYYQEKLWRLPQTYIAVDGFEVGVPDLRRDDLQIPEDAIVYLSSQTGLKRNPNNVRLQLQILQQVPNSYFLIKSFASDRSQLECFFFQIAEEVGLSVDRLRFMPDVPSHTTHRANLALADIVLDTYPYNGATTSLEALWMGLPIVTHVGEQFAARNTYTMLVNAGIEAGIAWSEQEYLDWGIRLGQDTELRQNVAYQLRRSRHTAPLWNGQKFAREMEQAYEQMWQIYRDGKELK